MNERKTEALVRSHFTLFLDHIILEEQRSDNPKIDKLLKTASKKGSRQGYPEFIITYKTNPDLLIVIECKADTARHESKDHSRYAEYAVDGVLLYASYLSKEYDVLAIAVSGETKKALMISHFLHLKDEKKAVAIFDDKFLTPVEYLSAYLKSPEKYKQDYNKLLDFTKKINEKLHGYKILESQRSLLISSILIALENPAFKRSYASHKKPENLAASLVQTVSDELESANIAGKKLENLNIQFSFIKTDTSLSKKENVLKEIIDQIDENINSFIKTHKYFDVLGQLYVEFLRYANSDKGLGIVLTPPHITDFFADLAQANKNSVVYDNCAGTGGFLISAMKRMIADAKGNNATEKEIKTSQLIGTEYQSHIFALAISNMYIHQDGKTNIINGSCFDDDIMELVKAKKPTIGFLNPPYKANKKTDTDELEFVLNNLECLIDGGTCIAIVPAQSALSQSGKAYELKKKLLEKHTLEAVLSMPDELFFNSKVNVVTCIMIFTAHKPHPKNKETYFGYYKDDGFIKRKNKGRIDAAEKWESIKEKWLLSYYNRKTTAGLSVNKIISADMEWLAESYMDTDYTNLTNEFFEDAVLNYMSFLMNNRLLNKITETDDE
ncbi:MAG: SAM-dependent methyltransferase [Spirochaetales bacterium]|jgi:type I restriction-modification system DNA methylase subunit|nr:SAM-dependent methyltransferase [Spirochaetales bacterium]